MRRLHLALAGDVAQELGSFAEGSSNLDPLGALAQPWRSRAVAAVGAHDLELEFVGDLDPTRWAARRSWRRRCWRPARPGGRRLDGSPATRLFVVGRRADHVPPFTDRGHLRARRAEGLAASLIANLLLDLAE